MGDVDDSENVDAATGDGILDAVDLGAVDKGPIDLDEIETAIAVRHIIHPGWLTMLTTRRYLVLGLTAIVFLFFTALMGSLDKELFQPVRDVTEHPTGWTWFGMSVWDFCREFFRDFAIALVIAYVLVVFVEITSRQEQIQEITRLKKEIARTVDQSSKRTELEFLRMSKAIGENVLQAVFQYEVPQDIAATAIDTIFRQPVVRNRHEVEYTFRETELRTFDGRELVEIEVRSAYDLWNTTSGPISGHEIAISFGVFGEKLLQDKAVLKSISINELVCKNPSETEEYLNPMNEGDLHKVYIFKHDFDGSPNSPARVTANYSLIKELSDTEVWTSRYSTSHLTFKANVDRGDLEYGVRTMHAGEMIMEVATAHKKVFLSTHPVLPEQGFLFWWRPIAPQDFDGLTTTKVNISDGPASSTT